jgi:ABC-type transport system involved in multi-copper enzyme maturation permease subunit
VTWLIWRQYRTSAAISAALFAAFAVLVVITGLDMAAQFHAAFGSCLAGNTCRTPNDNVSLGDGPVGFIIEFTLAVPAVLGMFIGAPLVAREIETGTGQFAWTQAITRRRWLAAKVGWLLLAALAWGGAVGTLVTWWSGPKNAAYLSAFNPGTFDVQGIMPAAYSLFAMALGIAAGTVIRRVLPALGVTLFGYFGVRLIIMGWIRQHYMAPVTTMFSIAQDSPKDYLPKGAFWQLAQGFRGPNGPISLPNSDSVQVIGNGFPLSAVPSGCLTHSGSHPTQHILSCLANHGYTQYVTYQPADRYWPFQFIEAGIFVALAAALIGVTFAIINRRDA